jgi:general secretion pathway protein M
VFSTPWISRLTALLLLVVAIAAVYSFIVEPIVVGYGETDGRIEEVREQLSRYQRLAAVRPALEQRMQQSATHQASQSYYLSGGTDALVAAELQDRVNALIEAKGGSLRSIQPMPGIDDQGFRRITLRVQMTATIEALFETLYGLEAGTPMLFVESLDVQSRSVLRRNNDADGTDVPEAPVLTVGFDLSGFMPIESQ